MTGHPGGAVSPSREIIGTSESQRSPTVGERNCIIEVFTIACLGRAGAHYIAKRFGHRRPSQSIADRSDLVGHKFRSLNDRVNALSPSST
jgi:hypothetical protein